MRSAQHLSARLSSLRQRVMREAADAACNIASRATAPKPEAPGITVASVFNGIGCPLVALDQLNIPVTKLYLQDWDDYSAKVCAHHYPGADVTTLPRNAEDIREEHIIAMGPTDLLIITPPCTDFSGLKKGPPDRRLGMAGPTGKLMQDSLNIIQWYLKHNPAGTFILENVVFEDMPDWTTVCDALGQPKVMNANVYSYTHRRRAFWTNIDVPEGWAAPCHEPLHPNDVLEGRRLMLNMRAPTITASWRGTDSPWEHTGCPIKVWDPACTEMPFSRMTPAHPEAQYLTSTEAEGLMGLPRGYTDVQPCTEKDRLHAIGNGIDVPTLKHLLQHARWQPTSTTEAATRAPGLQAWAPLTTIQDAIAKPLHLNAQAMAEWLTPGKCPSEHAPMDWHVSAAHPTVEKDVMEWAHGADLRYEGDRTREVLAPNSSSCAAAPDETAAIIRKELSAGRMLGPFPVVPLAGFRVVPRAMKDEMEKSNKWRPISLNNLPIGDAVNEGIPKSPDPICLPTHGDIRQSIRKAKERTGRAVIAKRDIRLAYRLHQVRPEDWNLCGVQWDGQLFIDTYLSFGCRSSVDRFLTVSDAIEWALRRWGVTAVHYIDDFIFIASTDEEAADAVRKFEIICAAWNIPIKQEKDVGPGTNVELLGVVYDTEAMTASMPSGTLARIDTACATATVDGITTKAAASLVGQQTWAAACVPQAAPFVTALRFATTAAQRNGHAHVRVTERVRADLNWWREVVASGSAAKGVSILQGGATIAHTLHADAGTEWGLGAYDAEHFYKAKHTPQILAAAKRRKAHSSKFLELFNLLVMARVFSSKWRGKHVAVAVDNRSLPNATRRLTSPSPIECMMLREIALLQIKHGWTWEVSWIPRELNEAADALSKNDMPRFRREGPSAAAELRVTPEHLRVPEVDVHHVAPRSQRKRQRRGREALPHGTGRSHEQHDPARPTIALLPPARTTLSSATLERHLEGQLGNIKKGIDDASSGAGVRSYLKFADRCDWDRKRIIPTWSEMEHNVMLYMLDAVQSYEFRGADGSVTKKTAITAGSLKTYLSHINKWYAKVTNQSKGVTTSEGPAELLKELRRALPRSNCQKTGVTVNVLRVMLQSVRAGPDADLWCALFTLAGMAY